MNFFPKWAKNILFLLVLMISSLILVIVIEGLISGTELLPLNTAIEQAIVYLRTPALTTFLVLVTQLGSPFFLSFLAFVIAIVLFMKGETRDAVIIVVAMLVALVSHAVLKEVFQVTRPTSSLMSEEGWSFPSGHATVATAFFFVMAHSFFRKARGASGKILLVVSCIVLPALVSFSRLYLGAHWALDVLGGISLGIICVSLTVILATILSGRVPWNTKFGRARIPRP